MPNVYNWQLETPSPDTGPAIIPPASNAIAFRTFLGFGLTRPLRRDQKSDFANSGSEDLIRSCVSQILMTQCSAVVSGAGELQGELPWRPEFGSQLYRLKHKKGVVLQELARVFIVQALKRWEPRVAVVATQIVQSGTMLTIRLRYNVVDVNRPGNNVVISGITQTVDLPLAA